MRTAVRRYVTIGIFGVVCLLGVFVVDHAISAEPSERSSIIKSFESLQFGKAEPNGKSMASFAELWVDPPTGRVSGLVRFTKGSTNRHYHTFDYQLVVIQGEVIHETEKIPDSKSKKLRPGSYWFQPRGEVHQDTCLSSECILFMNTFGDGDTKVVSP